jgi:hypothetical protein
MKTRLVAVNKNEMKSVEALSGNAKTSHSVIAIALLVRKACVCCLKADNCDISEIAEEMCQPPTIQTEAVRACAVGFQL